MSQSWHSSITIGESMYTEVIAEEPEELEPVKVKKKKTFAWTEPPQNVSERITVLLRRRGVKEQDFKSMVAEFVCGSNTSPESCSCSDEDICYAVQNLTNSFERVGKCDGNLTDLWWSVFARSLER